MCLDSWVVSGPLMGAHEEQPKGLPMPSTLSLDIFQKEQKVSPYNPWEDSFGDRRTLPESQQVWALVVVVGQLSVTIGVSYLDMPP